MILAVDTPPNLHPTCLVVRSEYFIVGIAKLVITNMDITLWVYGFVDVMFELVCLHFLKRTRNLCFALILLLTVVYYFPEEYKEKMFGGHYLTSRVIPFPLLLCYSNTYFYISIHILIQVSSTQLQPHEFFQLSLSLEILHLCGPLDLPPLYYPLINRPLFLRRVIHFDHLVT
jgi:hypothetical protein